MKSYLLSLFYILSYINISSCINIYVSAKIENEVLVLEPHIENTPSNNEMIFELFNIFDNLPKDGYLGYREVKIFQYLTNPELPLTIQNWKWVCSVLCCNIHDGIDIHQFNNSYYDPARSILGTNLVNDWYKVNKASRSSKWM